MLRNAVIASIRAEAERERAAFLREQLAVVQMQREAAEHASLAAGHAHAGMASYGGDSDEDDDEDEDDGLSVDGRELRRGDVGRFSSSSGSSSGDDDDDDDDDDDGSVGGTEVIAMPVYDDAAPGAAQW